MTKVLLVEDDNNLREIYEARLAAEGYDIVTAKDGEEALEIAKQHRPELIISDVMMPRISGFEMLDILRSTNGLKDAKVIMLTALGQAEDKARADHLGADRYLVKSQVTLEDIVNAADELLNGVEAPVNPADVTPAVFSEAPTAPAPTAPVAPATPAVEHAMPEIAPFVDTTSATVQSQPQIYTPVSQPDPTAAAAPAPVAEPPVATVTPAPVEPQTAAVPQAPEPLPMPTIPLPDTSTTSPSVMPQATAVPQADTIITPTDPQPPIIASADPEPVATSGPEPVAIATPEPQVAEIPTTDGGEIPVIELPDLDVQSEAPLPEATDAPAVVQMPNNPDTDVVNGAQSANDEEAAIEQQIEQFIHTESVMPQGIAPQPTTDIEPTESSPADESANASIINSAVEQLVSEEPVPTAPAANEGTTDTSNASQISGKKMIQPMTVSDDKADLATLVAQEEMSANAAKGLAGPAVVADVTATPTPSAPPLSITPDAPTPGGVFSPNSDGSAQSNAL